MELAACVQSLGVVISDPHFNRELTDESSDVRDGVELLGEQLSQCLLKVNEMIVARQTTNTHAIGALQNAYGRWRSKSLLRKVGPEVSERSAAAAAADPAVAYMQNLASFLDEVDLAEALTGSLAFKIRRWHAQYSAAHEAADAREGKRSASISVVKGIGGKKGSCVFPGGGGGARDGEKPAREFREESKAAVAWKMTARKATKELDVNGAPAGGGEGDGEGDGGGAGSDSTDMDNLLNDMMRKGLIRGGGADAFGGRVHEAERKVKYLNSFLTTAGIMLGCLRRMTTLLVMLGPGSMTGDALLKMRVVAVGGA